VSIDQFLKLDFATAKRTHTDLVTGSFMVNCVSRKGLEAEVVAQIAAKGVRVHRRELQKAGFFLIGNQIQIGQETPAGTLVSGDSAEDFINVPVTIPIYYQTSWTVDRSAELLAAIRATLLHAESDYTGSPLLPGSVDPDGVPIEGAEGVIVQAWTVGTLTP
jgi:hypothetical protein